MLSPQMLLVLLLLTIHVRVTQPLQGVPLIRCQFNPLERKVLLERLSHLEGFFLGPLEIFGGLLIYVGDVRQMHIII